MSLNFRNSALCIFGAAAAAVVLTVNVFAKLNFQGYGTSALVNQLELSSSGSSVYLSGVFGSVLSAPPPDSESTASAPSVPSSVPDADSQSDEDENDRQNIPDENTNNVIFNTLRVNLHPTVSEGYLNRGRVFIQNDSGAEFDFEALYDSKLSLGLQDASDGPQVLILHTHSTESYSSDGETYERGRIYNTDQTKSVVAVGAVISEYLENAGVSVMHLTDVYDTPSHIGAYNRSLESVEKILKENPSIKIVIDLHRDTLIREDGTGLRPVTSVNGVSAAQIMFIIGTGQKNLENKNWRSNLQIAVNLQKILEAKCPTITRPIVLQDARYNQHLSEGSVLVQIGAISNTLEEAELSGLLFAQAVTELLDSSK